MKCSMTTFVMLAYLVGAFGTFGWVWNHSKGEDRCYVTNGVQHDCFTDNGGRSFYAGFFGVIWPVYWAGAMAIKATAP